MYFFGWVDGNIFFYIIRIGAYLPNGVRALAHEVGVLGS